MHLWQMRTNADDTSPCMLRVHGPCSVYLMLPLRPSGKNRPLPVAEPAVTMDTT